MSGTPDAARSATPVPVDDERSLLIRFERLLEREEAALLARDAAGLTVIADERTALTEQLGEAARKRRAGPAPDAAAEAELVELYLRLRDRHGVRSQVVRRHAEQNSRAIGVMAQAAGTGQSGVYKADGTVGLKFVGS